MFDGGTPIFVTYLVCNLFFCQTETQNYNEVFLRRFTTFFQVLDLFLTQSKLIVLWPNNEFIQDRMSIDKFQEDTIWGGIREVQILSHPQMCTNIFFYGMPIKHYLE